MGSLARRTLPALLALTAVWCWWHWRIEAPIDASKVSDKNFDDYVYYYPTLHYAFGELRAGRFPFWNPYQHAGSPFFATGQHILLYPLNLPYLILPTAEAEKAAALLHLTLAFLAGILLGRTLSQSWPAALVAGVTFTFAAPVAALVSLPHHLYAVVWMPVELALAHRVCEQPLRLRWMVLLGSCVAVQYLGGYPMYVVMSVYAVSGYCAWRLWGTWRTSAGRQRLSAAVLALAAAAVLAFSLSAPQLLPELELAGMSVRGATPLSLEEAAVDSVHGGASLLRAVLPMHDDAPTMFAMPNVGVPALLLAALALAAAPARPGTRFFVGLTAITWLLGLGTNAPLFQLYCRLPGGSAFRFPFRFFPLTALGLAVLAGFGTDVLWSARGRPRVVAYFRALALSTGVALVLAGHYAPIPVPTAPTQGEAFSLQVFAPGVSLGPLIAALGWCLLGAGLWLSWYLRSGAAIRSVLVSTLPAVAYAPLFLAPLNTAPMPATDPALHTIPERAAAYLRAAQGVDRTYVVPSGPWRYLSPRSGILHGLYVVGDRENVYVTRFADYAARLIPEDVLRRREQLVERTGLPPYIPQGEVVATARSSSLRLLDLLGVRFVIEGPGARFDRAAMPERFPLIFDADGVRIYRNVEALPRTFLVHRVEVVPEASRVLDRLTAPDFDPRTTALVEHAPPLQLPSGPVTGNGTTRIVRYEPDQVEVDIDAPAAGLLVLTDEAYPGWEARVSGQPAEILVTDYLFRGVPVPAGVHRVVFRFVPRSFAHGLVAGAAGLAAFGLIAVGMQRWAAGRQTASTPRHRADGRRENA